MSEAKTTSFNAWISDNAIRLMQSLNMSAPFDEDAFQDAYLSLASACRKQEKGAAFERAFVAAYRKFSRRAVSETYTTTHPDDLFFTLLPTPQEAAASEQQRKEQKDSLAQAIRAHIRATYSRNEVAIWEMRMGGTSIRDIADALGISRSATDNAMRRITEQTRAQFAYTF